MKALNLKKWLRQWLHSQPARPTVPDYVVERVGRGAALLDARKPDWALLVPHPVDLTSDRQCVLGQVFGSFGRGYSFVRPHMAPNYCPQMVEHGFSADDTDDLPLLEAEWRRVIRDRQA